MPFLYRYVGRLLLGTGGNQQRVTTARSGVHAAAAAQQRIEAQAELDQLPVG